MVVDDAMRTHERVRLHFEPVERYDAAFYATELIRACESIGSPMGWDRHQSRTYLRNQRNPGLAAFGDR